jgi:hypothetical protein
VNIKEAKQQIKNAMTAYLAKDEYGRYVIPPERQRPVFLMGPPGIGKTAVMEQIAQELEVALVAYSMTHHTRQSALGLPFITKRTYRGREYDISEYTMSEIIASVYDKEEETGMRKGILFLDEINCVSETLAPAMLQFLQYKIFGRHRVPDGWIVVTAGNPPEYNNSVREFDTVTWDRLKRVDIEPDYAAWKEYAYIKGVHPAVLSYLDIKSDNFYKMETTVDGKNFVTSRGWVDLSDMMQVYENRALPVDEALVSQYLQNRRIAKNFAVYYDLFNKYRTDYHIGEIVAGKASAEIKDRARAAKFDERLAVIRLMLDQITAETRAVYEREKSAKTLAESMGSVQAALAVPDADAADALMKAADEIIEKAAISEKASGASGELIRVSQQSANALDAIRANLSESGETNGAAAFKLIKSGFDKYVAAIRKDAKVTVEHLKHVFAFCDEVFEGGQETLILVTELTVGYYSSAFISRYGCDEYYRHNKELLFHERQKEIIERIDSLDIAGA